MLHSFLTARLFPPFAETLRTPLWRLGDNLVTFV